MRLSHALAAVALLAAWSTFALAGGGHDCGCQTCCPCEEIVKEKKVCWNVECKEICIPGICWPLCGCCGDDCGKGAKGKGHGHADQYQATCGHVRTVRVLKPEFYDVEKCKLVWKVEGKGK
jgi:hypothetical protein